MKTIKLFSLIAALFLTSSLYAQVTVNVAIGSPPQWGPVGYTEVRYYYLPAIEAYYDVQTTMFIYSSGGVWVRRYDLPPQYRNYDLYGGYKVVMTDYRGDTPYIYFKDHKAKYNQSYRGVSQRTIGEKPGNGNSKPNGSNGPHGQSNGKGKKG